MLKLEIKNFKCFRDIVVPINYLSVFTGCNGNGKSTAIQALLFLRHTIEHCAKRKENHFNYDEINGLNVELNGAYCLNLGNSAYVLPVDSESLEVSLGIFDEYNKFSLNYSTNTGKELWLTPKGPLINEFKDNPLYFQEFYYLNAERIGPRLFQPVKFYDYYNVGFQGEYTAQIMATLNRDFYDFKVDEERANKPLLQGSHFGHHVNAWLDFILQGVSVVALYDNETHHIARIEVQNPFLKGNSVVPTNTGFGISYALPIIVSGLIAKKDRLFIVENPEAHLHPSAQSKMGHFLGVIANAGVRVIVETHSDHIINGIQLAVAKKIIAHKNVTINFFNRQEKEQPEIIQIDITEKGELTQWPSGFFDQSQKDFAELFKIRRE